MGQPTENGANGTPSSNAAKYNIAPHFIGGSHLGAAPPSKVKDFVAAHGGHTVIQNVSMDKNPPYLTIAIQITVISMIYRKIAFGRTLANHNGLCRF